MTVDTAKSKLVRVRKVALPMIFFIGWTAMSEAAQSLGSMKQLVSRLSADAIGSSSAVERALGVKLTRKSEGPFTLWSGAGFRFGDVTVRDVDYREPNPSKGSRSGPLLVLRIKPARRVTLEDVQAAFPNVRITGFPGGSRGEHTYLSVDQGGGRLQFGIAEDQPRCLDTIVFSTDRSG